MAHAFTKAIWHRNVKLNAFGNGARIGIQIARPKLAKQPSPEEDPQLSRGTVGRVSAKARVLLMALPDQATNKYDVRIAWIKYSARVLIAVIGVVGAILLRHWLG